MDNVVRLPRPAKDRKPVGQLALYFRIGRDQHKDVLDLLAQGETAFFGCVIEARYAQRHRELRIEANRRGLDVVLDPNTQSMATIGGHTTGAASLPWGLSRPHRSEDFAGSEGKLRARQIAEFAKANGATQLLGPTHLLSGPNDVWIRRDIDMMKWVREELDRIDLNIPLIYPLALPMQILRDAPQRQAIIAAIEDAPKDSIWLKVDNFGQDATGEKVASYIEACEDFRQTGLPLIADHVGGLPGLALVSFGAVGGLAQGITLFEAFKANSWRRPKPEDRQSGGVTTRVYLARLDMLLKEKDARAFLDSSSHAKSHFGCRNTHCCPAGVKDQLQNPSRHYVHTKTDQIRQISAVPPNLRIAHYLDSYVRPISDDIASVSRLPSLKSDLKKMLEKKQKVVSRYRKTIAHLAKTHKVQEPIESPPSRAEREKKENK